jgi:hypothetical protein
VTVTATRERQSDLDEEPTLPAWDERPIVGNRRGLPWWAAVLLAFVVAALAAYIDLHRQNSLGRIYQVAYILGCLLAIALVRRRNLFGPMVQPPLVFAVTAIGGVILNQPGPVFSTGLKQLLLSVALPLTSNFPTMAITTGVVLAIGGFRLWRQRDPNPKVRSNRPARDREPAFAGDRADPATRRPRDRTAADPADRRPADRSGSGSAGARTPRSNWATTDPPPRSGGTPPRSGRTRADQPPADRPQRGDRSRSAGPSDSPRQRRDQPDPNQPRRPPRRRPPSDDNR